MGHSIIAKARYSLLEIELDEGEEIVAETGAMVYMMNVDSSLIVDTGHIVTFEEGLEYKVRRTGGWKATLLSDEDLLQSLLIAERSGSKRGR